MSNNIMRGSSRRIELQKSSNISESRRGMWFWSKIHRGRECERIPGNGNSAGHPRWISNFKLKWGSCFRVERYDMKQVVVSMSANRRFGCFDGKHSPGRFSPS